MAKRALLSARTVKVVQFSTLTKSTPRPDPQAIQSNSPARDAHPANDDSVRENGVARPTPAGEPIPAAAEPPEPPPQAKRARRGRRSRRAIEPSPAAVLARALDPQRDQMRILARFFDSSRPLGGLSARSASVPGDAANAGHRNQDVSGQRRTADQTDFWRIWLTHRDYLQRHSLRFSNGNPADAEDAMSEAMLRAVQAFSLAAIRNHRAWLLRLVHNACIDRHRNSRRQNRLGEMTNGDGSVPALVPQHNRSPEETLTCSQQVTGLQQAISTLPRSLAEPLLLHLDEVSDAEIAGRLNITKEVVRKRRQMARDWLRRQML